MRDPGRPDRRRSADWDEALERLEDFILGYPPDRALPDLATIVEAAQLPPGFLRHDERAHKVLLEAVTGRPLSTMADVAHLRSEVDLLSLEVEILTERVEGSTDPGETREAAERLAGVRLRLEEIREQL